MRIYLDESKCKTALEPFSLIRHCADIRVGILSIKEKWIALLGESASIITGEQDKENAVAVPANIIPRADNYAAIIDYCRNGKDPFTIPDISYLQHPWNIFQMNDDAIRNDFAWITKNRSSPQPDAGNRITGTAIFIEEGASVSMAMLNATTGPIYIGKNVTIMEGAMIRGPFAALEGAVIKMGAKIYGATTIGVECTAGGEIKNSVLFDYSNKAHDGYLGDSVIGSWCNLGAGTSNSNVKNTGGAVTLELPSGEKFSAGNKAGLILGDYSRTAINTSIYTGTWAGICCNIFGNEIPGTTIPHFSWNKQTYRIDKAIADISNWKQMKRQRLTEEEVTILKNLHKKLISK